MVDRHDRQRTFGIEEEYLLLDARTGIPVNSAAEVMRALPELHEQAEREFLSSQLETATPICRTAEEAETVLRRFRVAVARAVADRGIVLASPGVPPIGGDTAGTVTPRSRYRRIQEEVRGVGAHHYAIGTHVHVEVPSRDAGVDVLTRIARWMPALLALTANSPLWCGEATGFASWRHVQGLAWPVSGYPLGFEDGLDYDRSVAGLIAGGVLIDAGHLTWVVRLSERYPTVELRIADAQLEVGESVAFAVIVRALVSRALREAEDGVPRPRYGPGVVDGAIWLAARDGLGAELIDPLEAEAMPAFTLIARMIGTIEAELERSGDRERVDRYLKGLREAGGPADRQLAAFEAGGIEALLRLYRSGRDAHHSR